MATTYQTILGFFSFVNLGQIIFRSLALYTLVSGRIVETEKQRSHRPAASHPFSTLVSGRFIETLKADEAKQGQFTFSTLVSGRFIETALTTA